MINFSIIVPHKDIPFLLEDCLLSIPQRDDVQIIVVDDNSNNENKAKLHSIEQRLKQNYLFIYLNENQAKGAGCARNAGLSHAVGKWVIFADSDDTFESKILNAAFDKYVNSDNDIIYFGINCLDTITKKPMTNADKMYLNNLHSVDDAENKCRYKIQVPWGKFIKRKLIDDHNIKFDETKVGNDAWFSLQVGFYAKSIEIDYSKIYNWMVRSGSITSNKGDEALMTHLKLANRLNTFKETHGLSIYRSNLLAFIPMMVRAKIPFCKAIYICIKYTSISYLLKDLISIIYIIITRNKK